MLAVLYQPLPPGRTIALNLAVVVGVALYCLAYTALSGVAESPLEGILWAAVNVVPFLLAFEALKRFTSPARQALILIVALAVSVVLETIVFRYDSLMFEVVRRLPSAALVLLLARLGPLIAVRRMQVMPEPAVRAAEISSLPLAPGEIDWVAAAGNYVELHTGSRTVLHRAPLVAVEALLAPHGFVRIHRSRLVARRAVAKLRATDVVLHDGVSLKIGARFRAALVAALG
jgi:hypothetical protein